MLRFGGLAFEIEPRAALRDPEREWLARVEKESGELPRPGERPCRLRIVPEPPFRRPPGPPTDPSAPAEFAYDGERVRIFRDDFAAEIDPDSRECRFHREAGPGLTIQVALKVTMACVLPLAGGLVLHSAAIARDGRGLLFFGPSGAGKSTLAESSPFPVLSDELVALDPARPFAVRASGFWGTLDRADAPRGASPVAAAFSLEKGASFEAVPLDPRAAARRLLGATLVPSTPRLWSAALAAVSELVRTVPVYRMAWTPLDPPWEKIGGLLEVAG